VKQEGDSIAPGDVLCTVETDKATVDFEMQEEGYIAKILYPAGTKDIPLGSPLAVLVEEEEDIAAFANFEAEAPAAEAAPEPTPEPTPAPTPAAPAAPKPAAAFEKPSGPTATSLSGRKFVSPLAANLASAHGVDLSSVSGTGPNGRVIRADIEDALTASPQASASIPAATLVSAPDSGLISSPFEDLENSQIRKVIADRLTYSK